MCFIRRYYYCLWHAYFLEPISYVLIIYINDLKLGKMALLFLILEFIAFHFPSSLFTFLNLALRLRTVWSQPNSIFHFGQPSCICYVLVILNFSLTWIHYHQPIPCTFSLVGIFLIPTLYLPFPLTQHLLLKKIKILQDLN